MKRFLFVIFAILSIISPHLVLLSCTGKTDSVVVAYSPFESAALFWIAQDNCFFERNNLNVAVRKYDTGAAALDGMLRNEADIVVGTSEFPVVGAAFQKEKIKIIGAIDKAEIIYLVARKDRGIEKVADLKGKMVGTTPGTVANFYLGRFLNLNGMDIKDVVVVDLKRPEEWVSSILNADVDAICTAQPYIDAIKETMGDKVVVWPTQSNQPVFGLVISSGEWIENNPEIASRFLKSLAQAEEYLTGHPAESKVIVQRWLDVDTDYMETVWSQNQYSLSLNEYLILSMEDEARWMINNNLTTEKQMPDFTEYIYEDGLKAVEPNVVNIIR